MLRITKWVKMVEVTSYLLCMFFSLDLAAFLIKQNECKSGSFGPKLSSNNYKLESAWKAEQNESINHFSWQL